MLLEPISDDAVEIIEARELIVIVACCFDLSLAQSRLSEIV